MKKLAMIVVASVAVMGMATSVFAQGAGPKTGGGLKQGGQAKGQGGGRMMMRGKMMDEIVGKLGLSADQKKKWDAQVKAIREEREKARAGFTKGQKPTDEQRKAMMAKFKAQNDKLMAILTKTQQAKYKELMKAAMEKMMKERGAGGAGKGKGGGGL